MRQLCSACITITRMSYQGSSHGVLKRGCHTSQADKQVSHCSAVLGCFLHLPHIWLLHKVLTCVWCSPLLTVAMWPKLFTSQVSAATRAAASHT